MSYQTAVPATFVGRKAGLKTHPHFNYRHCLFYPWQILTTALPFFGDFGNSSLYKVKKSSVAFKQGISTIRSTEIQETMKRGFYILAIVVILVETSSLQIEDSKPQQSRCPMGVMYCKTNGGKRSDIARKVSSIHLFSNTYTKTLDVSLNLWKSFFFYIEIPRVLF